MKKTIVSCIIIIVLMSTLLAGCAGPTQTNANQSSTVSKLVIGTTDQVTAANIADDGFDIYRETLTSQSLVRVDANGSYASALAESWETQDGKTWTFHMVKNATWHDGVPVTSQDVKFSLEYLPEKLGGSNWNIIDTVEAPDNYTVIIKLKTASANFLNNLLMLRTVPMHIFENVSDPKTYNDINATIGCGPYKFVKFDKDAGTLTFKAYDNYYGGKPAIDEIVIRIFNNEDTMMMALEKGEIDTIYVYSGGLDYYYVPKLLKNQNMSYLMIQNIGVPNVLWFNENRTPYDSATFRQAVSYAINYEELKNLFTVGYGSTPNAGFLPNGSLDYVETRQLTQDVNKSKELLDSIGIKDTDGDGFRELSDGSDFRPAIMVKTDSDSVRLGDMLKKYFNAVGLDADIKVTDGGTFWDNADAKKYDMFVTRTTPWGMRMDAGYATGYMDSRDNGWPNMNDSSFTALVDQAIVTTDRETSKSLAASIQQYYAEQLPAIGLYWNDYVQPYNNKYTGYVADPIHGILSYETYYGLHAAA